VFAELIRQHFVHTALLAGAVVSIVAGAVGVFVVIRGLSFAVHATSELGFTGAAGALVAGIDPVIGLLTGAVVVAFVLGILTADNRERDAAVGSFLAFGLGSGVLLLSYYHGYATAATNLLFGSIVGVSDGQLAVLAGVAAGVLVVLAFIYRPLLFASVDPLMAEVRGVPVRLLSVVLLVLLALTAAEAVQVVGVLLILTLVVTPAAAAVRIATTPLACTAMAIAIALTATTGGILLSLVWDRPTSFFVAAISFGFYVSARLVTWLRGRTASGGGLGEPSADALRQPVGVG
jgi:zinc/manganese transport system permease protein